MDESFYNETKNEAKMTPKILPRAARKCIAWRNPSQNSPKSNHFGKDFETSSQLLLKTWMLKNSDFPKGKHIFSRIERKRQFEAHNQTKLQNLAKTWLEIDDLRM